MSMLALATEPPLAAALDAVSLPVEDALRDATPLSSLAAYGAYLRRLHAFHRVVEPALFDRIDRLVPNASGRRKVDLLAADLAFLETPPLLARVVTPRIDSDAAAMGVAYVLERCTLQGRVLLAAVRAELALDVDRGATFIAGYGPDTGALWRSFASALELFVEVRGGRSVILSSAKSTFACLSRVVTSTAATA